MTEVLTSLGYQRLSAHFKSATEVPTSLGARCLFAQRWRYHPEQWRIHHALAIKKSGLRRGVIIPQHELGKIWTTYSFSLQDNIQLYFIKFHYVITTEKWIHEIFYIPMFTFWKRNTGDPGTYPATNYRPPKQEWQKLVHQRRFIRGSFHPCSSPWST